MKASSLVRVVRDDMKYFDIGQTIYDVVYRVLNRIVGLTILRCVYFDKVDGRYLEIDNSYDCRFMSADELRQCASLSINEMREGFINEAIEKGDRCYGIYHGDELASFGWYATEATRITPDLVLKFSKSYSYMYNGFTFPGHRGKHLHAIGMTMALQDLLQMGYKGLVSYVESNNFKSLKSVYRTGYKDLGDIYIIKLFGEYRIYSDRECRDQGFIVEQIHTDNSEGNRDALNPL